MFPWPFQREIVNLVVPHRPGVYVLYRGERPGMSAYVGRSDTDLRSRILASAANHRGVRWFSFEVASSPLEAYDLECRYYHALQPTNNLVHPDAPAGTDIACPVCGWRRLSVTDIMREVLSRLSGGSIR